LRIICTKTLISLPVHHWRTSQRRYRPYAYIGARKHLREFVQEQAQEVGIDPAQWFGTKKWQSDSGAFPDFVLACEPHSPLGNGALLELKDSAGDQIASFNSTLPSARKQSAD
jgi:hypothetical protein